MRLALYSACTIGLLAALIPARPARAESRRLVLVERGKPLLVHFTGKPWKTVGGALVGGGKGNRLVGRAAIGEGDFAVHATLSIDKLAGTAAAFQLGGDYFGFDGGGKRIYTNGALFGGGVKQYEGNAKYLASGKAFVFTVTRRDGTLSFCLDGRQVLTAKSAAAFPSVGFYPLRATMRVHDFWIEGNVHVTKPPKPHGYTIPILDLAADKHRQVVVDREKGQYLGHVTTVLLEDGKTILAVYPKGHGRGAIVMKRSTDGGKTWSDRLPVPKSWATSKEVPTIYRTVDPKGVKRLILFSGLYPIRMAVSEDDGHTWSELKPIGDYGGIVACADCKRTKDGRYLAWFHDDGRFFKAGGTRTGTFLVYQIESQDGGLTWGEPRVIATHPTAHLCEPGVVRSPDGKQLAMLFRENSRRHNGFVIFSNDEGATWTKPVELPGSLTGDRHTIRYAPDGRLVITFRDTCLDSPTKGDWAGWVGTYEDIVQGRQGQYRLRLMDNHRGADCCYPGLELLPDGTFVATTYGHWTAGQSPYIVSVRFTMAELDAMARRQPTFSPVFVPGKADGYPHIRIPSIVCTKAGVLLAFAEGRQGGDHSENDIIAKRSTDLGKTWSKVQVVDDAGKACLNNPQAVVLPDTGRVLLMYQRYPKDRHTIRMRGEIGICEPGYEGDTVERAFVTHSDDDGKTWSKPREITRQVKRPERIVAVNGGPGVGIVLRRGKHKGRILMPHNELEYPGSGRMWRVYAVYSDDGGQTWHMGQPAPQDPAKPGQKGWGNEVQMVELADGTVLLNSRSAGGARLRKTARSRDGGVTWSALTDDPNLIEPQCMASILRYSDPLDGAKSRLLYAGPNSKTSRSAGTVHLSYDEGRTWPVAKVLYAKGYAYSCLVTLPDGSAGCLFERDGYKQIAFARFTLAWLTGGKDVGEKE